MKRSILFSMITMTFTLCICSCSTNTVKLPRRELDTEVVDLAKPLPGTGIVGDTRFDPSKPYITLNFGIKGMESKNVNILKEDEPGLAYNPNSAVPLYNNHLFSGWYLDSDFQTPLSDKNVNVLDNGTTIYAKWREVANTTWTMFDVVKWDGGFLDYVRDYAITAKVEFPKNYSKVSVQCIVYQFADNGISNLQIINLGNRNVPFSASKRGMINERIDLDLTTTQSYEFNYKYYGSKNDQKTWNFFSFEFRVEEYRNQTILIKK